MRFLQSTTRTAALGLLGYVAHAYEGGVSHVDAPDAVEMSVRRAERAPATGTTHEPQPVGKADSTPRAWPNTFSLAAYLAGFAAWCKAKDDAVDAAQVERAVHEVVELLDEHLHRQGYHRAGSKSHASASSVSVDSSGFRAVLSIPRDVLTAEMLVEGIRAAVRSLQSRGGSATSLSLSKQDTVGQKGRASSIRVETPSGNLKIDLLQPFDVREVFEMEVHGDLLTGSLEMMRATLAYACSPSRVTGSETSVWDVMLDGRNAGAMLGAMEDVTRLLMEETRRAGIAMGELDVDRVDWFDRAAHREHLGHIEHRGAGDAQRPIDEERLVKTLEERGIRTYLPVNDVRTGNPGDEERDVTHVDWRGLAGYEDQKRQIEENLLLPLRRPDVFDAIAAKTRAHYSSNRPRAILFTGPPGTGKTSSARVIASQAGVPLCYIPLEAIASKWYGESEKKLSEALEIIDSGFEGGAVIFLDELDSLATTRGNDMHEATRRMLGVLLRFLDGFDQNKRAVVVGATNTPGDLDPALRSRFSANIEFGLPNEQCRVEILKQYAQNLPEEDVNVLAKATSGFSGRDLRDVAASAERHWATQIIKGVVHEGSTPGLPVYLHAVRERR